MDLKGKRVLVVGLGRSGVASALFLKARGARVTVSDSKAEDELQAVRITQPAYKAELVISAIIQFHLGLPTKHIALTRSLGYSILYFL